MDPWQINSAPQNPYRQDDANPDLGKCLVSNEQLRDSWTELLSNIVLAIVPMTLLISRDQKVIGNFIQKPLLLQVRCRECVYVLLGFKG